MTSQAVRVISLPTEEERPKPQAVLKASEEKQLQGKLAMEYTDPFAALVDSFGAAEQAQSLQDRILSEISVLESQNRWQDIVDLFYPVTECAPQLCAYDLDIPVRYSLAFALGQLKRFDQALDELHLCIAHDPNNFRYRSSIAYTLTSSLRAAAAKEIILPGQMKKTRLLEAHEHFQAAQRILPDRVTVFYREGSLYKDFDRKNEKAIPLLAQAVRNWEEYAPETKQARHQERKNAIKARYALASCLIAENQPKAALEHVQVVIQEDSQTNYLKNEHKHFALGKVLHALNRYEESLKALETASVFTSVSEGDYIHELAGRCYLALGQPEQGLACIERIPVKARRSYVRWTEADCLAALGRLDEAREVLLAAAERDRRGRHKALIRLARLAYGQLNFHDVQLYAEKSVAFHREAYSTPCADGLFWQAVAAVRLGNMEQAQRLESELTAHRPQYPWLPKLRQILHGKVRA